MNARDEDHTAVSIPERLKDLRGFADTPSPAHVFCVGGYHELKNVCIGLVCDDRVMRIVLDDASLIFLIEELPARQEIFAKGNTCAQVPQ